ncbi:MAG: embR2 [Gaiellaceae bacterium]|nr:embR2 [Gaiellaceae bacterium]
MEFRILGPLEVLDGEQPVPISGAKPRALLGALLLHANEVVSTARLIDELWGERPPATAENLVQGYVHALRKQLGADAIVTQAPGYRLQVDSRKLDLLEFERLLAAARAAELEDAVELRRRALGLWRGPPLADVRFEGSARHESGRLSGLRLDAQNERIQADLELGRHALVTSELEALVRAHPYHERLHTQLMLALYRSGRQAEALEAYRTVTRTLSEELGLQPGQDLRELQSAILRQDESLDLATHPSRAPVAVTKLPPAEPELDERPLTVLVADIVGTKRLGEQLGPHDAAALVGECLAQMRQAVDEYGGSVQADHEDRDTALEDRDAVCAHFGAPNVREDDRERAVRAALRIQEVVGEYARDVAEAWGAPGFAVRVGIITSDADVGPRETTTVAVDLANAAQPATIAVDDETARRLAHRFTFEPLGTIAVAGREQPVAAARLVAPIQRSRPFAARPLVGREQELLQLQSVLSGLEAGRGQSLLIVGEPGIGKTRLLAELRSLLPAETTWLEGHCLSYGGLPSWPFIDILQRWLGVGMGDPEVVVRTRARARLAPLFGDDPSRVLPGLARLLRVDVATGTTAGPEEIRRGYVAWVEALTRRQPVVLAIDDLHWAHASSRALAEDLLALTDRAPLLLVATLRREPSSEGWRFRTRMLAEYSHRAAELSLEPLDPAAAAELLGRLLPGAFDDQTREEIVARAEGNPLYLEELLRALVEGGGLEQRHRTWTTTLKPSLILPPALENLLVARIDALPPGPRRLAQTAALIGREFPVGALEEVAGSTARRDLDVLLRAEIVREVRRYPELHCAFLHGLVQEAALTTLTPSKSRELYARVASAFEQLYASSLEDHLERLAHYYARAGDPARAVDYLEGAAARAAQLGADSRAAELRQRSAELAAESAR